MNKITRSFIIFLDKFIYSNKYTIIRWLSNQHHQVKAKCVKVLKVYTSEVKIKLKPKQRIKLQVPTEQVKYTKMELSTAVKHNVQL